MEQLSWAGWPAPSQCQRLFDHARWSSTARVKSLVRRQPTNQTISHTQVGSVRRGEGGLPEQTEGLLRARRDVIWKEDTALQFRSMDGRSSWIKVTCYQITLCEVKPLRQSIILALSAKQASGECSHVGYSHLNPDKSHVLCYEHSANQTWQLTMIRNFWRE